MQTIAGVVKGNQMKHKVVKNVVMIKYADATTNTAVETPTAAATTVTQKPGDAHLSLAHQKHVQAVKMMASSAYLTTNAALTTVAGFFSHAKTNPSSIMLPTF